MADERGSHALVRSLEPVSTNEWRGGCGKDGGNQRHLKMQRWRTRISAPLLVNTMNELAPRMFEEELLLPPKRVKTYSFEMRPKFDLLVCTCSPRSPE